MDDYWMRVLGAGAVTVGALTTATALYFRSPEPVHTEVDYRDQSVETQGKDKARISRLAKDGKPLTYLEEDVQTMHEAFKRGARVSNNGPCLGWKPSPDQPYKWISYNDVLTRAANAGAGFIKKGQSPTNSTRIGVYSQNRPEYFIVEQACYMYSMVIVPLYDTLGVEACNWIINQAELSLIVVDKNTKVSSLLSRKKETPDLRIMVVMEEPSAENIEKAKDCGVELVKYSDLEKLGEDNPVEPKPATPDDTAIVCYTSGTTGLPKGAVLTHRNILTPVLGCLRLFASANVNVRTDDVLISYLPLAHSYERLCEGTTYYSGGRIGFSQGDVKLLMDDIKELQPTVFPSVPRLLNRVYDKVMAGASESALKKTMLNMALASKEKEIKKSIIRNDSLWDKLVFKKIQASLGGRVRLITTGSAPLSPKILMFLRCCCGCPVLEGYGQTECGAICSLTMPGDGDSGNVGPPLANNFVKMADVPDMKYFAADNKGEICIKGPNVFKGYLNDPEKTKEALDDDGWLHTGDVGEWLPNGTFKIIDRKKHIFKLAQGEYIAPEKIEQVYVRCPAVAQVFVYGQSLKSCLVGVVVVDPETLPKFAQEKAGVTGTVEQLVQNEAVKKAILTDLTEVGKKSGLQSFEQVKDIFVTSEMFSVENGMLTPTFKTKRRDVEQYYAGQMEQMYSKLT